MGNSSSAPDPDLVYSLYEGVFKPQIVRIALLLDVFSPLMAGPADAGTVAQACGCDAHGMHALLDYLSSLQLLERQGEHYSLSPTAAAFLVPGRKTYAGGCVLAYTGSVIWDGVLQPLRDGEPSHFPEPHAQDAWLESYSSARVPYSLNMWRAAGIEPGKCPGLRVLDMACGCAIKSLVLAQADATVRVTCLDSAEVLGAARDLADRWHVLPQVTFVAGDLFTADVGIERYDAALLGQITHYLIPAQNIDIFKRIRAALVPGGVLVIDAPMASEPLSEWAAFLTLVMWAWGGGAAHSFATYRAWLEDAGFQQVALLSERWLSATK